MKNRYKLHLMLLVVFFVLVGMNTNAQSKYRKRKEAKIQKKMEFEALLCKKWQLVSAEQGCFMPNYIPDSVEITEFFSNHTYSQMYSVDRVQKWYLIDTNILVLEHSKGTSKHFISLTDSTLSLASYEYAGFGSEYKVFNI